MNAKIVDLRGNPIKRKASKMYRAVKENIDPGTTVPRLYLVDDKIVQVLPPDSPQARYPLGDMVIHAAAERAVPQGDEAVIPLNVLNVIQFGAKPGEVPRHKFFGVVARLKEADLAFSVDQIVTVLMRYPEGIASIYPDKLREQTQRC
jgi:hypothetical protein